MTLQPRVCSPNRVGHARAAARFLLGLTVSICAPAAALGDAAIPVRWEVLGPRRITNPPFRADKPEQAHLHGSGKVYAFALHPARAEVMYAGTGVVMGPASSGGLYKSEDGGTTWRPKIKGLADVAIGSLWIDGANPGRR